MTETKFPIVVFDDSSRDKILDALGFKPDNSVLIDEDGLIQNDQQFEKISAEDFGGVLVGSKIVIRKDASELIRYFLNQID